MRSNEGEKAMGIKLPPSLIHQLHIEAVRSGQKLKVIVAAALEAYLPDIRMVVVSKKAKASPRQEARHADPTD